MIEKRKGSGESDGENLERMRLILSLKNWRNELASDCVSGVSGMNWMGCGGELNFKVAGAFLETFFKDLFKTALCG